MIKIYKSTRIWRHIPSLYELQESIDPDTDPICTMFDDAASLDPYFKYTGLRLFTNGADPALATGNMSKFYLRSEYKYYQTEDGELHHYPLTVPDRKDYILI